MFWTFSLSSADENTERDPRRDREVIFAIGRLIPNRSIAGGGTDSERQCRTLRYVVPRHISIIRDAAPHPVVSPQPKMAFPRPSRVLSWKRVIRAPTSCTRSSSFGQPTGGLDRWLVLLTGAPPRCARCNATSGTEVSRTLGNNLSCISPRQQRPSPRLQDARQLKWLGPPRRFRLRGQIVRYLCPLPFGIAGGTSEETVKNER